MFPLLVLRLDSRRGVPLPDFSPGFRTWDPPPGSFPWFPTPCVPHPGFALCSPPLGFSPLGPHPEGSPLCCPPVPSRWVHPRMVTAWGSPLTHHAHTHPHTHCPRWVIARLGFHRLSSPLLGLAMSRLFESAPWVPPTEYHRLCSLRWVPLPGFLPISSPPGFPLLGSPPGFPS